MRIGVVTRTARTVARPWSSREMVSGKAGGGGLSASPTAAVVWAAAEGGTASTAATMQRETPIRIVS